MALIRTLKIQRGAGRGEETGRRGNNNDRGTRPWALKDKVNPVMVADYRLCDTDMDMEAVMGNQTMSIES